jgi:hypothetical protein
MSRIQTAISDILTATEIYLLISYIKVRKGYRLVPQGVRQKSKVKSQNEYTMSFPVVWNGLFISADLY